MAHIFIKYIKRLNYCTMFTIWIWDFFRETGILYQKKKKRIISCTKTDSKFAVSDLKKKKNEQQNMKCKWKLVIFQ